MSRVQLALNVTDLDQAVAFYSKLFATEVNKRKPGYANFAIADPPLKLVLVEAEEGGTLNHLGVEVETALEVAAAEGRLTADGIETTGVDDTVCCYAEKTETWVADPDGAPWEVYVKTGDAEQLHGTSASAPDPSATSGTCCSPVSSAEPISLSTGPAASSGCC
jgi:catechol 2,3-dioxygenase-like lactoylglutathione lyase family enzyme